MSPVSRMIYTSINNELKRTTTTTTTTTSRKHSQQQQQQQKLTCNTATTNGVGVPNNYPNNTSNQQQQQQSIESGYSSLTMSPASSGMGISPVGASPMAHHHTSGGGYVSPSPVHPNTCGGLSPIVDIKPTSHCAYSASTNSTRDHLYERKEVDHQSAVYYSAQHHHHHYYTQQSHHHHHPQMMTTGGAHHHQLGMTSGYENMLPPPQPSM